MNGVSTSGRDIVHTITRSVLIARLFVGAVPALARDGRGCVIVEDMAMASKSALRDQLLAARRRVADDVRAAEARMLRGHLERMVTSDSTVCAYVPVGGEPGSIEMLDVLLRRAGRVLLPVARTAGGDLPLPLRWGE
ncbi:5-formyltetrahydrofolate cyclo-ligase [Mycobacterium tuberculosis]|uniref:5-formyltetrahydrofolate cyclo-ligase n=1 Tax=Mycobacterium tuberculosis TaxID=1773 RepID=A0A916L7F4_MYCTX|nr:5-formyltetrahydrofolate cyclo-ligase [Mycobacterium tuberculosis]